MNQTPPNSLFLIICSCCILDKLSPSACPGFVSCFFLLYLCIWVLLILLYAIVDSFSLPFYETIPLFIHFVIDAHVVASRFHLLWIELLWTFSTCYIIGGHKCAHFCRVVSLNHGTCVSLTVVDTAKWFSKVSVDMYTPASGIRELNVSMSVKEHPAYRGVL